jgi:hypothetical protein
MSGMRRSILVALSFSLLPLKAQADEYVSGAPSPNEIGRFVVASKWNLKVDSMTGASWYLCSPPKKNRQAWCRFKEIPGLIAGPVGRYRLATEGTPAILFDSVSGRSWVRCDAPTTDKVEAWCSLDE